MKTNKIIASLTVVALSAWVVGCKEETKTADEKAAATTDVITKSVESAKETGAQVVADVKTAGAQAVEDVKAAGAQAVAAVTEKAKEVAAPASAKAQELIDSAKSLFSEGKFADALAKLSETSSTSPSAEQQSVVANLKAQIEKAMAATTKTISDATKSATNAISNFLPR
jgi:hypothetical protein